MREMARNRSCFKFEPDLEEISSMFEREDSTKAIANYYGVCPSTVNNFRRQLGFDAPTRGATENNAKTHDAAVSNLMTILDNASIEYVSGRVKASLSATFRCKECGHTFKRKVSSIKTGCISCPACEKLRKERENLRKQREQDEAKTITSVCIECGCTFSYVLKCQKKKYCSERCGRRARSRRNRPNNDRRRRNAPTGGSVRPTWRKLYDRGEHKCYLCGEDVDLNDFTINSSGAFIAGDKYPSLEHPVALANGGLDSFDNARIAHCRCNSLKRDLPLEVFRCQNLLTQ